MSHLTPHRHVRITPGGGAAPTTTAVPAPPPDTSWQGLIADLASALGLEGPEAADFAVKVDDVAAVVAGAGDLEVARTRVRAALFGNVAMLTEHAAVDLSDARVDELLASWDQPTDLESDRVVARLALMHTDLVEPDLPPGLDETVGEGSGGSAVPLPETEPDIAVGQVGYSLDEVPATAKGVIVWIGNATTDDDRRARAQAAHEVEEQRQPDDRRKSVLEAIAGVLDG